jgi:hypothetical protein
MESLRTKTFCGGFILAYYQIRYFAMAQSIIQRISEFPIWITSWDYVAYAVECNDTRFLFLLKNHFGISPSSNLSECQ